MLYSIMKKEWIKLKFYFLGMIFIIVATIGYFWFNLDFSFTTIEPESMMWYKFSHLQDKPYSYLYYLFLSIGGVVSLAQFLPERISDRIKIMVHLPLKLRDSLFYHLFIGASFIAFLCTISALFLITILSFYYPGMIMEVVLKDMVAYSFASIVLYITLSGVILEKKPTAAIVKFIALLLFSVSFFKEYFTMLDFIWVLFLAWIPFLVLDSLYSIKEQRFNNVLFKVSGVFIVSTLIVASYINYKQNYKKEFNDYYIFYSNIAKDFVYQKNFGKHLFEYGIKDKKTFTREEYESYLPFVYWRNLDIQKKLPVTIDNKEFDKKTIKNSRLGFSYRPTYLNEQEVKLYPLLNPDTTKGMIKFPEEMFGISKHKVLIYDYDNGLNKSLSDELTQKLKSHNFKFPALNIWGKATNIKPYDKGYIVQDSNKNLFNIKRKNSIINVKKVNYPKGIDIAFIKLSENKQKLLSGYAIDIDNNFYLLDWNFKFIKVNLENFDYQSMKLKLISNPLNYLIRYDNGDKYYAEVFDKNVRKIKSINLE